MIHLFLTSAGVPSTWVYALVPPLLIFLYAIYNIWLHPLRQYPGPLLWRAFRIPYVVSTHKGRLHSHIKDFHTIYGPIVRIAPDELSYADSRAWKDIYTTRPGHQPFQKNQTFFKKMKPDDPHSILGYDEAAHARLRRAFAGAFSEKSLKEQAPIVEGYVDVLIARLRASQAKTVDLENLLECFAFDVASDLSFGESFNCLKSGIVHPWVEVAKGFGQGLALVASVNQYPPIDRLLRVLVPKKVMQKMEDHATMSSAMAQKRLAMQTTRPDFVTPTKAHVEAKGGVQGKEWDTNLMFLVFAGSETIASALTAAFRELVQHRGVLERLTTEIREAFADEEDITIASTAHLAYLNAVVNETLRLDPPTVVSPPRVVPEGGDVVCGRFVPGGTYVAYNQFPANRQPTNFHSPNTFLPERFLVPPSTHTSSSTTPTTTTTSTDNMLSFHPFGIGRHQCIGLKLAHAEIKLVLARTLWALDLRLEHDDARDRWDWGVQRTFIFWEKRALRVVVSERERGV